MNKIIGFLLFLSPLYIFGQKSQLQIQTGHQKMVMHSSISPDETKLFTVDYDHVGILWDITSGKQLRTFKDLMAGDFENDSRTILLASNKQTFQTVDLSGNVLKNSTKAPANQKMTNWSRKLYGASNQMLFHSAMIDAMSGNEIKMNSKKYDGQAYAPTLRQVVLGGSGDKDGNGTIDVCDAPSGALLRSIPVNLGDYENAKFISFSSDGQTLLVGSRKKILILNYTSGAIKYTYKPEGDARNAVLAPDGKSFLVAYDSELQRINAQNGSAIWIQKSERNTDIIFNIAGSKIVDVNNNIQILDAQTGKVLQRLTKHPTEHLYHIFATNDKKELLTQGDDKFMIRWNLTTGTMEKTVETEAANYCSLYKPTPDGKKVFKLIDSKVLLETDLLGTTEPYKYPKSDGSDYIWALDISADNRYALISSYFEDKKADPLEVIDLNTHQKIANLKSSSGTGVFGNTKNIIATKEGWDSPILNFYDVPSGKLLDQINDPMIEPSAKGLLFSENDRYLAFDLNYGNRTGILEINSKKIIQLRHGGDADDYTVSYKFSPDNRYFITGSYTGSLNFYNLETQQLEPNKTVKAHLGAVSGISFSKDGRFMFTVGEDNTIKVWNYDKTKPNLLATLYAFAASNNWAVTTPGGHFDATPGAQESMYYVNGTVVVPMSAMYEKFYAPRLLSRILNGEKIDPIDVDVNKLSAPPTVKILPPVENTLRNLVVEDDKPNVRRYEMSNPKITITIAAECPSVGVSEIRLFQNGKIVGSGTRNLVVEDEKTIEKQKNQKFDIQLVEGENTFSAIAINAERTESQPDDIIINYKAPKVQNNSTSVGSTSSVNLYLVVIGINKYKNPKYNLNYAIADATGFKEAIEKVSTTIFSKTTAVFLNDEKATKEGITAELDKIKTTATAKDVFIFYYAGHGVLNEKKEFYLVPHDVTQLYGDDGALAQKGLSANQLQQFSKDIAAQKQLFILDACQSAGALEQIVASRGVAEEKAIAQLARATGTHWLTASGSDQFASEFKQLGHGTFTYVLLEALSGKADLSGDKKITVKEIDAYLQQQVPEITSKYKGTPQYPASYGYGNDFPIGVVKN